MSLLLAIIGLGILIIVHEAGHMFVARLFGMRVDRFSLGFGPPLFRWQGKKTAYQLAVVPLGGFVQIAGMNPHEELPPDDPGSYANKPPFARFATILAGPLTNYVFAALLMIVVALIWGRPDWEYVVGAVDQGSPAQTAGLHVGDQIVEVDGRKVATVAEVVEAVNQSQGKQMSLVVLRKAATMAEQAEAVSQSQGKPMASRGEKKVSLQVQAKEAGGAYRIGIQFARRLSFADVSPGQAVLGGLAFPVHQTEQALGGFKQLFSGKASVKQVGGPLEIVRQLKMSFEQSLIMAFILLAILSVYLGLFNLLPVPALDGGRLVFVLFTMITRRPVNQRVETAVHTAGFILLLGLILLVTFGDVMRIFAD